MYGERGTVYGERDYGGTGYDVRDMGVRGHGVLSTGYGVQGTMYGIRGYGGMWARGTGHGVRHSCFHSQLLLSSFSLKPGMRRASIRVLHLCFPSSWDS